VFIFTIGCREDASSARDRTLAGPLKVSYGKPLNVPPTGKVQKFQFTLGNLF
jgi:outer membrane protein assembly factor BamA